jgi:hypothetical protein
MKRQEGSAYLEIIISVALITGFLVPAYSKFLNIDQVIITSDQMVIASNIANQVIEDYRSSDQTLVAGENTKTTSLLPEGQIDNVLTEEDSTNPSLMKVVTTVSWQGIGSSKKYQVATEINQ